VWLTADAVHVDLRGLEPPEPMVAILQTIDGGELDTALVAHFDREPIFLYPELEDRGWSHKLLPFAAAASFNVLMWLVLLIGAERGGWLPRRARCHTRVGAPLDPGRSAADKQVSI
jgi:hypothetical protein